MELQRFKLACLVTVLIVSLLASCSLNEDYSCTEDSRQHLAAAEERLREIFPNRDEVGYFDDCNEWGRYSGSFDSGMDAVATRAALASHCSTHKDDKNPSGVEWHCGDVAEASVIVWNPVDTTVEFYIGH